MAPAREGLLLAIDQGTSSTKAVLVDRDATVVASSSCPVGQRHPGPGQVEQSAEEIWASVQRAVRTCVDRELAARVVGVAISVQRESVVLWDTVSGAAVGPILSWQDRRLATATAADALERGGHAPYIRSSTGLPLDPMFSALKAGWLLDTYDPSRARAGTGAWKVGTLDAWLLSRFGGPAVTEIGNASRTQLLDIGGRQWDPTLLDLFDVPRAALPDVVASLGPFPPARGLPPLPDGLPVLAVLGDSHAALFAQARGAPGVVKATYGTGSSVMTLGRADAGDTSLCSTIAWQLPGTAGTAADGVAHATEANIRSTGRTISWLADLFQVDPTALLAEAATASSDEIILVPAFGGLAAPWWDRDATPVIIGVSLGTGRPQLARAALESVAFQIDDVITVLQRAAGPLALLACDGGLTRSEVLMQLQADVSGLPVRISATPNLSALGAALLAGVGAGWWTLDGLPEPPGRATGAEVLPRIDADTRARLRNRWADAVARARSHQRTKAAS
ncbi:carbohydrate kinase FGGY [Parafrankia sp. EAN1pec]|uniref:FGGY-family carbohydrate kinase n=1 Tax=Parafrankia sp. (strain EAN1pec) TaxID=298653 RepID=UPI0000540267|nr:carbohydrate kinase FGGY [Frankia sp. EAN1pec]